MYAPTLEELREKEAAIDRDKMDGIKAEARYVTLNELFELWCQLIRSEAVIQVDTSILRRLHQTEQTKQTDM